MTGLLQNLLEEAYISKSRFSGEPFVAFASGGGGQIRGLESIESVRRAVGLDKHAEGVTSGGAPSDVVLESCRKLGNHSNCYWKVIPTQQLGKRPRYGTCGPGTHPNPTQTWHPGWSVPQSTVAIPSRPNAPTACRGKHC